ncbi:beta-galactosidase [Chloroflexi bacterium TSY]|nr:beta-galactosidase [Chloroflexi bacterium TSY]
MLTETLTHPAVSGVFLRYDWSEIEPAPGRYDFSSLDEEVDRIVEAGRVYSLAIKAGVEGTPAWLGDELHLPLLQLLDTGGDPENPKCGTEMFLGDPTDRAYAQRYFQMLHNVAEHLKENTARYRALAYIKASGANLHSHENRLPKRCQEHCPICNPEVWAANGYTPDGLYEFYDDQFNELATRFPHKTISYQLIQAGFPRVLDADHYEGCITPDCEKMIPGGTEQTETILDNGTDAYTMTLAVQHNGLGPIPQDVTIPTGFDPVCLANQTSPINPFECLTFTTIDNSCPNEGNHPADPDPTDGQDPDRNDFAQAGSGCPNKWVLYEGSQGQVTGFQTNNTQQINTLQQVDQSLENARLNSDAVFIELYDEMIWLAARSGDVLDPAATEPRTFVEWASVFNTRRRNSDHVFLEPLPDPYPRSYSFVFDNSGMDAVDLTFWYTDPAYCDPNLPDTIGKIVVEP